MDAKMKKQLEQTITAIVEEKPEAAKKALQEYLRAKTHSILVRESEDKDADDEEGDKDDKKGKKANPFAKKSDKKDDDEESDKDGDGTEDEDEDKDKD